MDFIISEISNANSPVILYTFKNILNSNYTINHSYRINCLFQYINPILLSVPIN